MSTSFEVFALNKVPNPILLLSGNLVQFINTNLRKLIDVSNDISVTTELNQFLDYLFTFSQKELFSNTLQQVIYTRQDTVRNFRVEIERGSVRTCYNFDIEFSCYSSASVCCVFNERHVKLSEYEYNEYQWLKKAETASSLRYSALDIDLERKDTILLALDSKSSLEYFNSEPQHIIGKFTRKDLGMSQEETDKVISQLKEVTLENPTKVTDLIVNLSGVERFLRETVSFIGHTPEGFIRVFKVFEDLSEKHNMEQEILMKKNKITEMSDEISILTAFFQHCPVMLGVVDLLDDANNWIQVMANPEILKLYKVNSLEEVIGKTALEIGISHERIIQLKPMWDAARDQGRPVPLEVPPFKDSKSYRAIVSHVKENRYCYIIFDNSIQKQVEEELKKAKSQLEIEVQSRTKQLEEALSVKGNFLATMSHEMRTPLSGMLGSMTLLSEFNNLTEEQLDLVRIARICGEQLSVLINDILDLTKIENDKMILETESFSLIKLLEDTLDVVSVDAERKDLELILDIFDNEEPPLPDIIVGDMCRLRQILVNLLSNAVKFSSRGEVTLRANSKDLENQEKDDKKLYCQIQFSVSDQGIGISEDAQKRLFQPFTQADSSMTRKYGGSGLGLSISKRLVELMDGLMWLESSVGTGSTFYFTIKVQRIPVVAMTLLPSYCMNKKILIVTPSETLSRVIKSRLISWNFQAAWVRTVEDSLKVLKSEHVDLIMIDIKEDLASLASFQPFNAHIILMAFSRPKYDIPCSHFFLKKPMHCNTLKSLLIQSFSPVTVTTNSVLSKSLSTTNTSSSQLNFLRILLAEDNVMNQRVIKKILESIGCREIRIASNGREAFLAAKQHPIDLILMDVMMPEMTGIEATEQIRREISKDKQPIIIALTADAFPDTKRRCLLSGMDDLLTKPVNRNELTKVLLRYVKT